AIPKTYYIRAEIKYENSKGRLITSNSLKIPVNVTQGETLEVYIQRNLPLIILPIGVLIAAVIYIAYRRGRKRKEVKG
ncbi:MAG: hypothetical protein QXQ02_01155, partial [Halobacteria archaeon]